MPLNLQALYAGWSSAFSKNKYKFRYKIGWMEKSYVQVCLSLNKLAAIEPKMFYHTFSLATTGLDTSSISSNLVDSLLKFSTKAANSGFSSSSSETAKP